MTAKRAIMSAALGTALIALVSSSAAQAAIFTATPPIGETLNVASTGGPPNGFNAFTLSFPGVNPDSYSVFTGSDRPSSQDPATIESFIETTFNTGPLINVGSCDSGSSVSATCSGFNTRSGTYTDPQGFNYLSAHTGLGTHIFDFAFATTSFSVSGLPQDLSNFRGYLVPLPAALPLLGSALVGLWGLARFRARPDHSPVT